MAYFHIYYIEYEFNVGNEGDPVSLRSLGVSAEDVRKIPNNFSPDESCNPFDFSGFPDEVKHGVHYVGEYCYVIASYGLAGHDTFHHYRFKKVTGHVITREWLENCGACQEQVSLFANLFGNSVVVTENIVRAVAGQFNWVWLAERTLSDKNHAKFIASISAAQSQRVAEFDAAYTSFYNSKEDSNERHKQFVRERQKAEREFWKKVAIPWATLFLTQE